MLPLPAPEARPVKAMSSSCHTSSELIYAVCFPAVTTPNITYLPLSAHILLKYWRCHMPLEAALRTMFGGRLVPCPYSDLPVTRAKRDGYFTSTAEE